LNINILLIYYLFINIIVSCILCALFEKPIFKQFLQIIYTSLGENHVGFISLKVLYEGNKGHILPYFIRNCVGVEHV